MNAGARECGVCWWIYDPDAGDDEAAIPAGVPFDALSGDYACPRCGAAKARFVRPEDAAAGGPVEPPRCPEGR